MSAQQHRERQRNRVDTLEGCLRERDDEIAKLREQVHANKLLCSVSGLVGKGGGVPCIPVFEGLKRAPN